MARGYWIWKVVVQRANGFDAFSYNQADQECLDYNWLFNGMDFLEKIARAFGARVMKLYRGHLRNQIFCKYGYKVFFVIIWLT